MKKKQILLSGVNSFVGQSLVNKLDSFDLYRVTQNNKNLLFYNLQSGEEIHDLSFFDNLTFLHLATYFSKENKDRDSIKYANVDYGIKILDSLNLKSLEKIIYINTMYNFYVDSSFKELYYTETKNIFSDYLRDLKNNHYFDLKEVFLDNTFGPGDSRNKIVPNICKAVNRNESSPVNNPDNYINLIYIHELIDVLVEFISSSGDSVFNLYNEKAIKISSIYNFLNHYKNTTKIDTNLIEIRSHEYNDEMIQKKIVKFDITSFTNNLTETFNSSLMM